MCSTETVYMIKYIGQRQGADLAEALGIIYWYTKQTFHISVFQCALI